MKLPSARLPAAFVLGATLMAWRAYETTASSPVQLEMSAWVMMGGLLLVLLALWEGIRAYTNLNRKYAPADHRRS